MNGVSETLARSKMAITLELKLCPSNLSRRIKRQKEGYQSTNTANPRKEEPSNTEP